MSKVLNFVYEWIGPAGPIMNTRVPNIYDLTKRMPYTDWKRIWVTDDFDPVGMRYKDLTSVRFVPAYDLMSLGDEPFIYEITMSPKMGFEQGSLVNGVGVFENSPVNEYALQRINEGYGWLCISNILESFVDDVTIHTMHEYLGAHGVNLERVIYLSNCLNGQEIYNGYCSVRNMVPKIKFEYAGLYLLDHINHANMPEFANRKYIVGPREKLFLAFNRRYRTHRFKLLMNLFKKGLLDDSLVSFAEYQAGSSPWMDYASHVNETEHVGLTEQQLKDLHAKLPLVLDVPVFNRFPMEEHPYDPHSLYDRSLIHIITETNFEDRAIHITEKTIKPIMFKQPFLMLGPQGSLKHLRDMGFKTFESLWDESYDFEFDPHARFLHVMEIIDELGKLTAEERVELSRQVKDIVEFNFNVLRSMKTKEVIEFTNKYGAEISKGKQMKKVIVCGAGGFIGTHLVTSLKEKGYYVVGADLKYPEYSKTDADEFHIMDLRDQQNVAKLITEDVYEIYQLAADMGGAGYIFTGENDADIMHNSAMINLNIAHEMVKKGVKRVFYSSSACMYPSHNQEDPSNPLLSEDSAYPANPDSEYGWEKLFSERMFMAFARNHGIRARIARFHNIFGPLGSWNNGKEKAPAALCRKVAMSKDGVIEVWGPGNQTRSFLFIDECVEGIHRIMESDCEQPLNLGSERMISINNLVLLIGKLAGKNVTIKNIDGPRGVMGRNSHNKLIKETIGWSPDENLEKGLLITYKWIESQIEQQ